MIDWNIGFYRHFKGGLYLALAIVYNTETDARDVIYVDTKTVLGYSRPLRKWSQHVKWSDGVMRPRFVKVSALSAIRNGHLQKNPKV